MKQTVLVFMEYGVERMSLVKLDDLPADARYFGTYDQYMVYDVEEGMELRQYAVQI